MDLNNVIVVFKCFLVNFYFVIEGMLICRFVGSNNILDIVIKLLN